MNLDGKLEEKRRASCFIFNHKPSNNKPPGSRRGLALEVLFFALAGKNFLTLDNAATVTRLSVEIGLLAVALTPVIVGGGIDLSVGSLMGLSAVVFGKLWRDAGLPIGGAAA